MIHEALFRLWNNAQELSNTQKPEEWIDLIQLHEFLHEGEKGLLQEIVNVALKYYHIQGFVNSNSEMFAKNINDHTHKNNTVRPGLYVKAFCDGLNNVLKQYKDEVRILEVKFLENPQLSLSYVLSSLERFVTLFNVLESMINVIKCENLHGCLLVGRLHKYLSGGVESVARAVNIVINSVNIPFYTQLSDWIIYGDFVDNYNEFFVCDGNGPNPEFLYCEQLSELKSSEVMSKKSKIKRPPVVWNFYLNADMVPANISSSTAETILFMGTIIWIIKNEPKNTNVKKYDFQLQRDVWEGKSCEYYSKINSLKLEPFNLDVFNKTIEECRIKLNEYLWTLFVEDADLFGHLQIMRDYYALGRGELFQQFIVASEEHVKDTPNHYVVQNLNFIFTDTAEKMYSGNYKTYQRFELSLPSNVQKEKPWSLLEMNFEISWPLHIIFHPKAMVLYNKLFSFLLRLKKTHIDLHKLWLFQMGKKQKINSKLWMLRHHLMFLVNSLQYHLQVDVIEAQFSMFQESIRNASDFKDVIALHNRFMTNLLSKTFIMNTEEQSSDDTKTQMHMLYQIPTLNYYSTNTVHTHILNLLDICEKFCILSSTWDFVLTEPELNELQKFEKQCNVIIDRLMAVLNSLRKKTSNKHLLQLLLQLNYNGWYTKRNPDFNIVT